MTSAGVSSSVPWYPKPALQIITSSRPNVSTARATSARESASIVTSPGTASARPPAAVIARTTSSSRSARRARSTTAAPSAASARAVARPMPAEAPVMATTFGDKDTGTDR